MHRFKCTAWLKNVDGIGRHAEATETFTEDEIGLNSGLLSHVGHPLDSRGQSPACLFAASAFAHNLGLRTREWQTPFDQGPQDSCAAARDLPYIIRVEELP